MKPETHHSDRLNALLQTDRFGRACRWVDTVDSTNTLAADWAKAGAEPGSLVVADYQIQGRGRFNRSWTADPGQNLMFSLILDMDQVRSRLEFLPIALAVTIAETLSEHIEPHRPMIKWPNDVMLAGRKVCGILIESSMPSRGEGRGGYIVAGIGINVNQEKFPPELADTATSIFQVLGRQTDRILLLSETLLAAENTFRLVAAGETAALVERYEGLMLGLNKTVRFSNPDRDHPDEGTILGVDASGGLRVMTGDGMQVLRAGEVTFREEDRLRSGIVRLPDRPHPTSSS